MSEQCHIEHKRASRCCVRILSSLFKYKGALRHNIHRLKSDTEWIDGLAALADSSQASEVLVKTQLFRIQLQYAD